MGGGFADSGGLPFGSGVRVVKIPAHFVSAGDGLQTIRPHLSARAQTHYHLPLIGFLLWVIVLAVFPLPRALMLVMSGLGFFSLPLLYLPTILDPPTTHASPPWLTMDTSGLPHYTVLIPLYDEANMLPQIAASIGFNYPHERLSVYILLEEDDSKTLTAARRLDWPSFVSILIIPNGAPRTKSRACNIALHWTGANGLLVIYDAEDYPHRDQLREAAYHFNQVGARIACLQSPLQIVVEKGSWLQYQFQLEYRTLFKILLPSLYRANWPIPLSGTSNHFRAHVLRRVGGWDAWNLTEDADLGLRLYRLGYYTALLSLPTYENAPPCLAVWYHQRVRWIMGYLQTALVVTRTPIVFIARHGFGALLVMLILTLGRSLAAFAHLAVIFHFVMLAYGHGYMQIVGASAIGYAILCIAAWRAQDGLSKWPLLGLPLYWILPAPAAAWAIIRLAIGKTKWNKTPHQPYL